MYYSCTVVRHEDVPTCTKPQNKQSNPLSVEYTDKFRGEIGYVGAVDLAPLPAKKGDSLHPLLFMNIGKSTRAIGAYAVAERFQKAVHFGLIKHFEASTYGALVCCAVSNAMTATSGQKPSNAAG